MPTNHFVERLGHQCDLRGVPDYKGVAHPTLVGVEVELEGVSHQIHRGLDYWNIKDDGSLKNHGAEFVFKEPLGGKTMVAALTELDKYLQKLESPPITSERTSVHVHVDMRDMDEGQYINFIFLYMALEETLFKYCGYHRKLNTFSRALTESTHTLQRVLGGKNHNELNESRIISLIREFTGRKYCSINIGASANFGSIEFRGHRGEWRKEPLLNWINILLSLKKFVMENKVDWGNLLSHISVGGPLNYVRELFGEWAYLLESSELEVDVMDGVRIVQDFLYGHDLVRSSGSFTEVRYDGSGNPLPSENFKRLIDAKYSGGK